MKFLLGTIVMLSVASASETEIQSCLCKGMKQEVTLPSGARADCVSDENAIEVDPTENWAEALGQSLHYAEQTGKRAMIFLYCKQKQDQSICYRHQLRIESTIGAFKLPIEFRLWTEAEALALCKTPS